MQLLNAQNIVNVHKVTTKPHSHKRRTEVLKTDMTMFMLILCIFEYNNEGKTQSATIPIG